MTIKVTKAARLVGVSNTTIRNYSAEYAEFLSDHANPEQGKPRYFTQSDLAVFHTVTVLRADGTDTETIMQRLRNGERITPESAENQAPPSDSGQPQQTALVTQLTIAAAKFEAELSATKAERDRVIADLSAERDARLSAEKRAAAAEAALAVLEAQAQATAAGQGRRWWEFWKRDE